MDLWLHAGMGLPNRELFEDHSKPQNKVNSTKPTPTLQNTRVISRNTATNSTAGLTMSGLKEELSGIKDKVKDAEHRHSKATVIAAATIGSLLLAVLLGCAGMLAYNRFVSSQHGRKKGPTKNPYYDADRLLGDPTGL